MLRLGGAPGSRESGCHGPGRGGALILAGQVLLGLVAGAGGLGAGVEHVLHLGGDHPLERGYLVPRVPVDAVPSPDLVGVDAVAGEVIEGGLVQLVDELAGVLSERQPEQPREGVLLGWGLLGEPEHGRGRLDDGGHLGQPGRVLGVEHAG